MFLKRSAAYHAWAIISGNKTLTLTFSNVAFGLFGCHKPKTKANWSCTHEEKYVVVVVFTEIAYTLRLTSHRVINRKLSDHPSEPSGEHTCDIMLCWKTWFNPPCSVWTSTVWSRLGWSPRKYEAIPRTARPSKHYEHMYHGFLFFWVCKQKRERERERAGQEKRERGLKEEERQRRIWRRKNEQCQIERHRERVRENACIYSGWLPSFLHWGLMWSHFINISSGQAAKIHTHIDTHTYTHATTKTVEWPTYSFMAHVCSLRVMSL